MFSKSIRKQMSLSPWPLKFFWCSSDRVWYIYPRLVGNVKKTLSVSIGNKFEDTSNEIPHDHFVRHEWSPRFISNSQTGEKSFQFKGGGQANFIFFTFMTSKWRYTSILHSNGPWKVLKWALAYSLSKWYTKIFFTFFYFGGIPKSNFFPIFLFWKRIY